MRIGAVAETLCDGDPERSGYGVFRFTEDDTITEFFLLRVTESFWIRRD